MCGNQRTARGWGGEGDRTDGREWELLLTPVSHRTFCDRQVRNRNRPPSPGAIKKIDNNVVFGVVYPYPLDRTTHGNFYTMRLYLCCVRELCGVCRCTPSLNENRLQPHRFRGGASSSSDSEADYRCHVPHARFLGTQKSGAGGASDARAGLSGAYKDQAACRLGTVWLHFHDLALGTQCSALGGYPPIVSRVLTRFFETRTSNGTP